jgi:predicted ABC-type ATPase
MGREDCCAVAPKFLPEYANDIKFVTAHLIAAGVSPFSAESPIIRAGTFMLNEIRLFSRRRGSFGVETTLSGRSHRTFMKRSTDESDRIL